MHTPGPWEIDENNWADQSEIPIDAADCSTVCMVWSMTEPVARKDSISTANARLIAASPDLLEALRSVARIIENTYGHDEETGERIDEPGDYSAADIVEQLCGIEGLVSDAIAKATGCES